MANPRSKLGPRMGKTRSSEAGWRLPYVLYTTKGLQQYETWEEMMADELRPGEVCAVAPPEGCWVMDGGWARPKVWQKEGKRGPGEDRE